MCSTSPPKSLHSREVPSVDEAKIRSFVCDSRSFSVLNTNDVASNGHSFCLLHKLVLYQRFVYRAA